MWDGRLFDPRPLVPQKVDFPHPYPLDLKFCALNHIKRKASECKTATKHRIKAHSFRQARSGKASTKGGRAGGKMLVYNMLNSRFYGLFNIRCVIIHFSARLHPPPHYLKQVTQIT